MKDVIANPQAFTFKPTHQRTNQGRPRRRQGNRDTDLLQVGKITLRILRNDLFQLRISILTLRI
jgi:hypothetical protein